MSEQALHVWDAVNDLRRFLLVDPDPTHLTPEQLAETTRLTQIALEKQVQFGYSFGLLALDNPDMPQILTYRALDKLQPDTQDPAAMAAPNHITQQRIEAYVNSVAGPAKTPNP